MLSGSNEIISNLVNERFDKVINKSATNSEQANSKLEEFTTMFRKMVKNETKPIKMSAEEMLNRFELKNIASKEVKIDKNLTNFIDEEIQRQSNNKVELISEVEFKKLFEIASRKESELMDSLKKMEIAKDVVEKLQELLNEENTKGVSELVGIINKEIFTGEVKADNSKSEEAFEKLRSLYAEEKNDLREDNLTKYIDKLELNLEKRTEEVIEKKS